MRVIVTMFMFVTLAAGLAACNTGQSAGVLPRATITPPPSVANNMPEQRATARRAGAAGATSTSEDVGTSSTTEPAFQPVMTGQGVGAGFRF